MNRILGVCLVFSFASTQAALIDRGGDRMQASCPRIGSLLELPDYVRSPHSKAG